MEDSSDAEMSPFFAATGVAWKVRCEHTSTRNVRIARAMDSPCSCVKTIKNHHKFPAVSTSCTV